MRSLVVLVLLALAACGGSSSDTCPGQTCTDCARDCNLTCPAGQLQHCIADPQNAALRCEYCAP